MMIARLRGRLSTGASLVEAALCGACFFLLLFGFIAFAYFVMVSASLTRGSDDGLKLAAVLRNIDISTEEYPHGSPEWEDYEAARDAVIAKAISGPLGSFVSAIPGSNAELLKFKMTYTTDDPSPVTVENLQALFLRPGEIGSLMDGSRSWSNGQIVRIGGRKLMGNPDMEIDPEGDGGGGAGGAGPIGGVGGKVEPKEPVVPTPTSPPAATSTATPNPTATPTAPPTPTNTPAATPTTSSSSSSSSSSSQSSQSSASSSSGKFGVPSSASQGAASQIPIAGLMTDRLREFPMMLVVCARVGLFLPVLGSVVTCSQSAIFREQALPSSAAASPPLPEIEMTMIPTKTPYYTLAPDVPTPTITATYPPAATPPPPCSQAAIEACANLGGQLSTSDCTTCVLSPQGS
ncbi:MAG: hypothetical protein DCC75_12355 [Proteobacteria bacterium]|nr:MAG: hypothetical protein DCC75_12355 [Pseudomonadota bacterium]